MSVHAREAPTVSKMSKQIAIVAIATPAPGKLERVSSLQSSRLDEWPSLIDHIQFKEVTAHPIEWIRENEPETLQFDMYEAETEEGVQISLFER